MNLPTERDINPVPEDRDGQYAAENFLGKTREQITAEFPDEGMNYQEDLMFMGPRAFCFYFPAAVDYITSPAATGASDVVKCLCSVIETRLEHNMPDIPEALSSFVRFVDHVLAHYDDFALNPEIYGDLRPRLSAIRQACAEPDAPDNSRPGVQLTGLWTSNIIVAVDPSVTAAVPELCVLRERMNQRKLSDILIEIAMQGLKSPIAGHSEVMHPLMWLAHVAWNREVATPEYLHGELDQPLAKFDIKESVLNRDLISRDWEKILERMQAYKRVRFPDDTRFITMCAYTPQGTLRVEFRWNPDASETGALHS
jgi:hypothetical protein